MVTSDELRRLVEGFRYGKVSNCHFDFHEKTLEALENLKYVIDLFGDSFDEQKRIEKELVKHSLDGFDDAIDLIKKYYEIMKIINS